jgi:hypothetical protein
VTLLDLALIAGDPLGDEALEKAKLFGVDVEAVMNGLRANDRVGFLPQRESPQVCRFLDAGMTNPSTRCGGRRPKSAKARSRGKFGTGGAAGAMGI